MPTNDSGQPLKDFLASVDVANKSKEQLLAVLFEAELYPQLQDVLQKNRALIVAAIKNSDVPALADALQKSFTDVKTELSALPDQVSSPIREQTPERVVDEEAHMKRGERMVRTMEEGPSVVEEINKKPTQQNRKFIEGLVGPYTGRTGKAFLQTAEKIAAEAHSHSDATFEQIIEEAIPSSTPKRGELVERLVADERVREGVQKIQKETPRDLPAIFVDEALSSPDPQFFKNAFTQQIANPNATTEEAVAKAANLSFVADVLQIAPQGPTDYSGFFGNISVNGTTIEKALAPLADTIFSLFPKDTQEAIVSRVLGASWNKEVSNNNLLQRILGPTLQSSTMQQAIQKGNTLFETTGRGAVFTKTQSFFVDVFVTVFHPQVSETYLQLARLGNTQMGTSMGGYYAGLIAQQGFSFAAKRGIKTAGKTVAKKAAGTAAGKIAGTLAGSATGNPLVAAVGYLVGDILIDKVIGGLWRGAKGVFGFLTLDWLGKLVSGNYQSGPITKDPIFMGAAIVVGVICLLFVLPLLPFSLGGGSVFQQTVQDNAFVQGLGGEGEGPDIDCAAEPNSPLCSMKACNTAAQDCRWPTSGTITQGPYTACGGTHSNSNAIDIGGASGTDVYATINGTVKVFTGCEDNKGVLGNTCGNYLGNYVVVTGTCNGGGAPFGCTLTFGHLRRSSMRVVNGQSVQSTDVIGEMDHSGSSTGPHLHFSLKDTSGGNRGINEILPFAITHCSNGTTGCSPCSYPAVGGGQ